MKIEINKSYVNRRGNLITIISNVAEDYFGGYRFRDEDNITYTQEGRFFNNSRVSALDLDREASTLDRLLYT